MTSRRRVLAVALVGACGGSVVESGDETTSAADTSSTSPSTSDPTTTTTSATTTSTTSTTDVDTSTGTTDTPATCSDGMVDGLEQCDDGNDDPDDGCEPGCVLPSGAEIWNVEIDSGDDDIAYDIAITKTGDIQVVGSRRSETGLDTWLATYDAAGELLGETILDFGEGDDDESFSIAALGPNGGTGWVVAGVASPPGVEDGDDALLVALDGDLGIVWSRRIDAGLDDRANAVAVNPDARGGSLIAVAGNLANADTFADAWFAVYDTSGGEQWSRTDDGPTSRSDDAHGIAWLADGGLVVVGEQTVATQSDLWMSVREADGAERFSDLRDFEFGDDIAMNVIADGGDFLVTGSIASALTNSEEVWVARFAADGTEGAVISYNANGFVFDGGEDAVVGGDSVFVAGVTAAEMQQRNALVGRWPVLGGEPQWTVHFDGGPGLGDAAHAIALLPDGSVVAAGEITVLGQGTDAWIRRWSP